MVSTRVLVIAC